jgi:hypothetical protein
MDNTNTEETETYIRLASRVWTRNPSVQAVETKEESDRAATVMI